MEHRIIARRRAEREQLIQLAADYVRHLSTKLPVLAAYVAGSAARGDFNVWSDVDVVIVAEGLPERIPDQLIQGKRAEADRAGRRTAGAGSWPLARSLGNVFDGERLKRS